MSPRVTLKDISSAAGVSTFTVSKALNGGQGVSAKSREHVLDVARKLGYVPNLAAQELRGSVRSAIAVISAGSSNSYYLDMMRGLRRVMQSAELSVVLMDVTLDGAYDPDLEDRTIQKLLEARMSGVISTLTLKPESIDRLAQWDIPVVFVDSSPPESHAFLPSVTTDNHAASLQVGAHLAEHGYSDWLFVAYPAIWSSRTSREDGLREAARRHGASLEVVECANSADAARTAILNTLEARGGAAPRVLIAGNNPLLLGSLRALREAGLRIPQDVAVVSYDDFAWAPFTDPPLTVLDERAEDIGQLAAETLAQLIDEQHRAGGAGGTAAPNYRAELSRQMPVGLIIRRSCGCQDPDDPEIGQGAQRP